MLWRMVSTLLLLSVLGFVVALDDLVIAPPAFEYCEGLVVPVVVHTVIGGDHVPAWADLLERKQDIWFTKSHFLWFEPEPLGILVDLLQTDVGGFIIVRVHDSGGDVTWQSIEKVTSLQRGPTLMRRVVPVQIPEFDIEMAFPEAGVYLVSATTSPLDDAEGVCGSEASTSIIVEPAYR